MYHQDFFLREVHRYLGYGKVQPDETVERLIAECAEEVKQNMSPRHVLARFPMEITKQDEILTAGLTIKSHALAKNLRGCREVIFFAATLGNGVDMLINRYGKIAVSRAAVVQAVAAAFMEEYCDTCKEAQRGLLQKEGLTLRPGFSPGFADVPLSIQVDFLRVLDAGKKVGICLSEGNIMLPEKSVTAFMGICRMEDRSINE